MSILSVDQISPIGSGTTITLNATEVKTGTEITVGTGASIFSPAGNTLTLGTNNVEALRIKNTGFVGIKTSAPLAPLHAYNDTNNTIARLESGDATCRLQLKDSAGDGYVIASGDNLILANTSSITERLRIASNGNVGVGTVNPDKLLDVQGHAGSGAQTTIRSKSTAANASNFVRSESSDDKYIGLLKYGTGHSAYGALPAGGGAVYANSSVPITIMSDGGSGYINFATGGNTERLRISSTGKVGVNETSPDSLLHVTTNDSSAYSTSTTNTVNATNAILRLENTNGSDGSGVNNYVGMYFRVGSGANSDAQLQYVREGDNKGAFHFKARNAGSTYPNLMKISSAGYVTKPHTPMFIAGRTGGNQTFTIGTFPFNVTRINVGNHYSTSTYKFTAPVAGVYYFHAQVYYNNGSGNYRVGFRKEPSGGSAFMLNTTGHAMVGNDNTQTLSIIESMAVGDTVRLFSDQNASIQCYYNINDNTYGAHTYFMGYLIG